MRSYEVLQTFKYSPDGIKIVDLKKGATGGIKDGDIGDMIKAGYVKDVQSKKKESPVSPQGEPEESGDPPDNGMLLAMGRGHIEKILRHYGFELDKRKSLKTARAEMVECVLLNQLGDGEPKAEDMVKFYEESFGVKLELGNKTSESLAMEMATVLESAFSVGK